MRRPHASLQNVVDRAFSGSPGTFSISGPLTFFEKAGAPEKERRGIAGVISTELKDKQRETLLQRGLNFDPFLKGGWFNDNHSRATTDILGYPKVVKKFKKGETLPDGAVATANCTWAEGYLLDTPQANKVWELGMALAKAGDERRLGFSIEGQVLRRAGTDNSVVAEAVVRNVAITNCPVGEDTRMEVLAKSLEDVEKGLSMGPPSPAHPSESGPVSGEGAGKVLAREHLEGQEKKDRDDDDDEKSDDDDREVSKAEAIVAIQRRFNCDLPTAERALSTFRTMKQHGLL